MDQLTVSAFSMPRQLILAVTATVLFSHTLPALDFSLAEMAKQNRAREKAAEAKTANNPPNDQTIYKLTVPKTQAQYDYERKVKRDEEVDRIIQRAEETLRTMDSRMAEQARQRDAATCARWRSTVDDITIGADAMKSVMDVLGYPDAISKYRGVRGEIENWKYSNTECYISVDVLQYRVVNIFMSGY